MTPANEKTDATSRLREVAPQEAQSADDAAKLLAHHVSHDRDVRLDAALQRSLAELRPAEDSQSFLGRRSGNEAVVELRGSPSLHNKATHARWLEGPRHDALQPGAGLTAGGQWKVDGSRAKP